jgi:pyruvate dehydrogenase E2 component (dihydrolipoamide acetyltransferase)
MPELLRMPEIAANTEQATLATWPVPENQPYSARDVIATIETAKAAVDVAADADGVILRMLVAEGTDVQVGDAIALIGAPGERIEDIPGVLASLGLQVPEVDNHPARTFASPLARKLAREAGIPVESLHGTGPNGRIVRADVEAAVEAAVKATPNPPSTVEQGKSTVDTDGPLIPHSRLRRAIARRLTESKATIPHFYLRGRARVDALLALRVELNAASPVKISVNDLIVKAAARAHATVPAANVIWTEDGMRRFDTVDLGIAVATDGGLVTPVLRGVDRMSLGQVAATTRDLAGRAQHGGLKQDELAGGAATVTNLGMYGTEEFAAIINPPQSSILAVGAARREPVVDADGGISAATVLRVTLSVDHRAIDGALAAEWMRAFLSILEQPLRIVL